MHDTAKAADSSASACQRWTFSVDCGSELRVSCRPMPAALPACLRPLCAALLLAGSAAIAAPQADPVTQLLAGKGLLDAPSEPGFVQQVRQVRDGASDMVIAAMNFLGVRYRRGGNSADDGFDCSGFTRHIFETSLGFVLPRRVDEQASAPGLVKVKREELKPGDLVFFNTLRRTFSHVGIYVGEGKFIHSPRTGSEVRIEDMRFAYWHKRFTGARRAEPLVQTVAAPPVRAPAAETPAPAQPLDAEAFRVSF
jgi:cell wall-associated NlpC family hydrolase